MHYDFPLIRHIDDVLPHIEGYDEFIVAQKDGYTVINYNLMTSATFGLADEITEADMIRRECRGIIFCSETGKIIRRPLHKFFNLNERIETQEQNVDLNKPHHIIEKLDGSMIVPMYVHGKIIWGTKMGATDVAKPVEEFVLNNPKYTQMAEDLLRYGHSPIYEWCSRKQRIVIDYPEDMLVLTAVRDIQSGRYMKYEFMVPMVSIYDVPLAKTIPSDKPLSELAKFIADSTDEEGFVIRFEDGHMVKAKSDWYVAIHKAKEEILWDRNIVQLIMDEKLDDVMAHLPESDRDRLTVFRDVFSSKRAQHIKDIHEDLQVMQYDRKSFALDIAPMLDAFTKAIMFSCWDDRSKERVAVEVDKTILKSLTKNSNWETLNEAWFGVKFNS